MQSPLNKTGLTGREDTFFVPGDQELSLTALKYIVAEALGYTGFHGTTRKVAVTHFVVNDHLEHPLLNTANERMVHLAIYNQVSHGYIVYLPPIVFYIMVHLAI
jgi:hypothetical protein